MSGNLSVTGENSALCGIDANLRTTPSIMVSSILPARKMCIFAGSRRELCASRISSVVNVSISSGAGIMAIGLASPYMTGLSAAEARNPTLQRLTAARELCRCNILLAASGSNAGLNAISLAIGSMAGNAEHVQKTLINV